MQLKRVISKYTYQSFKCAHIYAGPSVKFETYVSGFSVVLFVWDFEPQLI